MDEQPISPVEPTGAFITSPETISGLSSILNHAYGGLSSYDLYIDDAEQADDQTVVDFFSRVRDEDAARVRDAENLLAERLALPLSEENRLRVTVEAQEVVELVESIKVIKPIADKYRRGANLTDNEQRKVDRVKARVKQFAKNQQDAGAEDVWNEGLEELLSKAKISNDAKAHVRQEVERAGGALSLAQGGVTGPRASHACALGITTFAAGFTTGVAIAIAVSNPAVIVGAGLYAAMFGSAAMFSFGATLLSSEECRSEP